MNLAVAREDRIRQREELPAAVARIQPVVEASRRALLGAEDLNPLV